MHAGGRQGHRPESRAGRRRAAADHALERPPGRRARLDFAGIARYFDAAFSVEEVRVYKPHPRVYLEAVRRMRVAPGQAMLVAAHGWDTGGAGWAGLQTAFVVRDGERPFPLAERPTLTLADLGELADRLGA